MGTTAHDEFESVLTRIKAFQKLNDKQCKVGCKQDGRSQGTSLQFFYKYNAKNIGLFYFNFCLILELKFYNF